MRFSIVTPVYNGEKYLAETIQSVISQEGDFEIEYIIRDGGSSDRTVDIIKKYEYLINENKLEMKCKGITFSWHSEKDKGMYDAINKGFAEATGDIFAWINSDDSYKSGAFELIRKSLTIFSHIEWIKGVTSVIDSNGKELKTNPCLIYRQSWIQEGIYGTYSYFIHQDSVFWRKSLWEKAGPIPKELRYAGDFALWISMAKHSPLWSINSPVSNFRKRAGQLSADEEKYREEQEKLKDTRSIYFEFVKLFFWSKQIISLRIHLFLYRLLFFREQMYYIDIDIDDKIKIKKAYSYIGKR